MAQWPMRAPKAGGWVTGVHTRQPRALQKRVSTPDVRSSPRSCHWLSAAIQRALGVVARARQRPVPSAPRPPRCGASWCASACGPMPTVWLGRRRARPDKPWGIQNLLPRDEDLRRRACVLTFQEDAIRSQDLHRVKASRAGRARVHEVAVALEGQAQRWLRAIPTLTDHLAPSVVPKALALGVGAAAEDARAPGVDVDA